MSQSRFYNLLAKKMTGEASPQEIEELDLIIHDNPDWAFSAGYIHKLWKAGEKETDAYTSELAFEEHLNKLKQNGISLPQLESSITIPEMLQQTHRSIKKTWWIRSVAAILVVFTIGLIWKLISPNTDGPAKKETFSEVYTRPGSKTKLVLPDSTVVWLNAGSKLAYSKNFGVDNRNTTLTGEAFFDVKKTAIPFIIHSNGIQIKVLGTAFNVKSYPNEKTETSLLRGKVEITLDNRPGEKYLLKPNEKLIVSNLPKDLKLKSQKKEPLVVLSALTPGNEHEFMETSWVDNKLVFHDESFADLAVKMERWYGVTFRFNDEKIAAQRLSGSFTTETIQEAMEALQLSTPFRYTLKSNVVTITK